MTATPHSTPPDSVVPTARTAPIWAVLGGVMDPEVPVLSVIELGIVRDVEIDDLGMVTVSVTPTYSGCPAMRVIEGDIVAALAAGGWSRAQVRTVYSPVWTTDWISEDARRKLRDYGIAPPPGQAEVDGDLVPLRRRALAAPCPYCGSAATVTRSEFGSTACKAVMYCEHCSQPFELFKAI
jgi:ring-1,2-phenylacetyl-CoA epoxidase subunit PaaD